MANRLIKLAITSATAIALGLSGAYFQVKFEYKNVPKQIAKQRIIQKKVHSIDSIFTEKPAPVIAETSTVEVPEVAKGVPEKEISKVEVPAAIVRPKKMLEGDNLADILRGGVHKNMNIDLDFMSAGKGLLDYLKNEKDTVEADRFNLYKALRKLKNSYDLDLNIDVTSIDKITRYGNLTKVNVIEPFSQKVPHGAALKVLGSFSVHDYGSKDDIKAFLNKDKIMFSSGAIGGRLGFIRGIKDCYIDVLKINTEDDEAAIMTIIGRTVKGNEPYMLVYNLKTNSLFDAKGKTITPEEYSALLKIPSEPSKI